MMDESQNGSSPQPNLESSEIQPELLESEALEGETQNTTIFVGSIPFESTEAEITSFFSQCGTIENCKLLLDPSSRRFKGSCFIRFDSAEAAQSACNLNGNTFMGRKLYISMSTSKPAPQTTHVFIGNLDPASDIPSLTQFFSSCGTVLNIKLITDKTTMRNRGFGFVEFGDEQSAKNSLALNGTMMGSRPIRIDFQRPKPVRPTRPRGGLSGRGRAVSHHPFPLTAPHLSPSHAAPPPWTGPPAQYPPHYPPNFPHLHSPHLSQGPQGIIPHPSHPYYPPSRTVHYGFQGYPMTFPSPPQHGYPAFPFPHMPESTIPSDPQLLARTASPIPSTSPMMKPAQLGPTSSPAPLATNIPTSPSSLPKIAPAFVPSYVISDSAGNTYPYHDYAWKSNNGTQES